MGRRHLGGQPEVKAALSVDIQDRRKASNLATQGRWGIEEEQRRER